MAATADQDVTSGTATVTYMDGKVERYDLDRPIYIYRLNKVYPVGEDTPDSDQLEVGMMIVWAAAGMPGLNGDTSREAATAAMEAWLDKHVKSLVRNEAPVGPPTKRPSRSRKSPA